MQKVLGCLANVHAVAELAQQYHQARAVQYYRVRIMRQQVEAVGLAGEQEEAQDIVACFGVETDVLEILFKDIQGSVRQAAQCIHRSDVIHRSLQFGVLQIVAHGAAFHCFRWVQYSRLHSRGKVAQTHTKIFLQ